MAQLPSDQAGPTSPSVEAVLEQSLSAENDPVALIDTLRATLKSVNDPAAYDIDMARIASRLVRPSLDYTSLQSLCRMHQKTHRRAIVGDGKRIRLAVLSSFTSKQLVEMIELFTFAAGTTVEVYEADYGVFRQEILDSTSGLYRFQPDTLFIATTYRDLTHWPDLKDDAATAADHAQAQAREWSALWQTAHDRLPHCQIIVNNFDRPQARQLANHEMRHPGSSGRFVESVNRLLQETAPPYVIIHDLDGLSAEVGRRAWGDEQYFFHAKMPCPPEFLGDYAQNVASLITTSAGLSKKCLVLDLDNTLWGGVIGDDGLGGIRLGQGDAEGEAFLAFQRYVKKLRQRGVILAVCSKNTDAIAREVFQKHPEMGLTLDDISCFVANWDDKATNLRAIAQQLNIGMNSLVFLDDNPAERAIARRLVPEVAVPEVSGDPLDFIRAIEEHRYFQMLSLGNEDLKRTEYYLNNAKRQQIESSSENLAGFLQSLQMVGTIGPINPMTLERSTQLINKSNQFNLTTIRRSVAQVLAISNDPAWITLTISLKDRFGDNGLISVLLADVEGDAARIDTWLMSCRVLKRNVERFLLDSLCELAKKRGLRRLIGRYAPTDKNALVKNHYPDLGFRLIDGSDGGECDYELTLTDHRRTETFIEPIRA